MPDSVLEFSSRRATRRFWLCLSLLILALLFLAFLNLFVGSVATSPRDLMAALLKKENAPQLVADILWKIRLPRMLAVMLLGGALSLAGFLLQTFFHNPIAGPFILGISSGAKLFVSLVLVVWLLTLHRSISSQGLILASFLGSMLSMGFVLLLAGKVRRASLLIVCGVMVGYICSAITDFVISFADDASIVNLHNWTRGSFNGISWDHLRAMAGPVLIASLLVFALSKPLAAFRLGENYARSVGVNVRAFRLGLVLLSSLLSACVTAFAGPISFVGMAVPHLSKSALDSSQPLYVIPVCFLGGSAFCLVCDLIARTAFAPQELSISSVTALFGAPVVIYVMLKRQKEDL